MESVLEFSQYVQEMHTLGKQFLLLWTKNVLFLSCSNAPTTINTLKMPT